MSLDIPDAFDLDAGSHRATNRGGGAHSFHFTYGPRSGWLGALAAIPIAILGVFSVVVVLFALVFVAVAVEIGARGFRFRAPRAPHDVPPPTVSNQRKLPRD